MISVLEQFLICLWPRPFLTRL